MLTQDDVRYMKKAIKLAKKGFGFVNPNPLVGALVVKDGKIIGKGYHGFFGGPHAEINAFNKAIAPLQGATLYVTMEPCNHHGKTPPCTDRIIAEKITRVVIGITDPNKLVNGKGISRLQQAGIEVSVGVLEKEVEKLNEVYIKFIKTGKPFVAIKTAMTLDGKIATFTGDSKWISNELSREFVHELRHRYGAILVGVNTVIKDNPFLTNRSSFKKKKHPLRVVIDSRGRTPLNSNILNKEAETIIAVTNQATEHFCKAIQEKGVEIIKCPEKDNKVDLGYVIEKLADKGIDSILIEGGSTLNFTAIRGGIVDKVYSFISPKMVGGSQAVTPVGGNGLEKMIDAITLNIDKIKRFDDDLLIESYLINK